MGGLWLLDGHVYYTTRINPPISSLAHSLRLRHVREPSRRAVDHAAAAASSTTAPRHSYKRNLPIIVSIVRDNVFTPV